MSQRTTDVTDGTTPVIRYFVLVVNNGETAAFLVGVIDCAALSEIFTIERYDGKAYASIVDYSDGSFILDSWHDELGNMYNMKERERDMSM